MTVPVHYGRVGSSVSPGLEKARERVSQWHEDRYAKLDEIEANCSENLRDTRDDLVAMWRELQGFGRVFSRSPLDAVRFNALVRPLQHRLVPFLIDAPGFNPDPRYVEKKTDLEAIDRAMQPLLNTHVVLSDERRLKAEALGRKIWKQKQRKFRCRVDAGVAHELDTLLGEEGEGVVSRPSEKPTLVPAPHGNDLESGKGYNASTQPDVVVDLIRLFVVTRRAGSAV